MGRMINFSPYVKTLFSERLNIGAGVPWSTGLRGVPLVTYLFPLIQKLTRVVIFNLAYTEAHIHHYFQVIRFPDQFLLASFFQLYLQTSSVRCQGRILN